MKFSTVFHIIIGTLLTLIVLVQTQGEVCKDVIKDIKANLWKKKRAVPMPQISCLLCSRPLCFFDHDECGYRSDLPAIPLYHNILEFGLVAGHIPDTTDVFVFYNQKCNLYLSIFTIGKQKIRITYSVCRKAVEASDCYTFARSQDDLILDSVNRCVQIGLIFYEKKKIYLAYSHMCNYVPTVYFNIKEFISIQAEECFFNREVDKPTVIFKFTQNKKRQTNGVPLAVPCTPGGYVVDPETGKFFVNEKCIKNFGGKELHSPFTALNFIITNIYNHDEDLTFPSKNISIFNVNPTPVYISADGRPASREEMEPGTVPKELSLNQTRDNCILRKVQNKRPKCKSLEFAKVHEEKWKRDPYYRNYVPLYSCFSCAEPECDYYQRDCEKIATTHPVPVYNNIFEFGLYGLGFPAKVFVRVALNTVCYLKIEIHPVFISGFINVYIYECLFSDRNCLIGHYKLYGNFSFNKECMFFGIAFHNSKNIYIGFSVSCMTVPSSVICDDSLMVLKQESCYFDTSKENLIAEYRFLQDESRLQDGVPLILPCTAGGFVVDPTTGRFVTGGRCESLYWEDKHEEGLQYVIKKFFDNNEDLLFPTDSPFSSNARLPFYVSRSGQALPADKEKAKNYPRPKQGLIRRKCLLLTSKELEQYEKSIINDTLPTPPSPRGVGALENENQTKPHQDDFKDSNLLRKKAQELENGSPSNEAVYIILKACILTSILMKMLLLRLS